MKISLLINIINADYYDYYWHFHIYKQRKFHAQLSWAWQKSYNLGAWYEASLPYTKHWPFSAYTSFIGSWGRGRVRGGGAVWKVVYSTRKEFGSKRSKICPFRVDTFSEGCKNKRHIWNHRYRNKDELQHRNRPGTVSRKTSGGLTHSSLASHKRDIGKQWRPRSDAVSDQGLHYLH